MSSLPLLAALLLFTPQDANQDLDKNNVVWSSPSRDSSGSMPLGNGDLAVNVWMDESGDLLLLIAKSDAWSGNGRLLKLGRVRISSTPNPLRQVSADVGKSLDLPGSEALTYRQELCLRTGDVSIAAARSPKPSTGLAPLILGVRVWVDAFESCIRIEIDSVNDIDVTVKPELWRTSFREITGREAFSAMGMQDGPHKIVEEPDSRVDAVDSHVLWSHRNTESIYPLTMQLQGLGGLLPKFPDPLLTRTFGCAVFGENLHALGPSSLGSKTPSKRHRLTVTALTTVGVDADAWRDTILDNSRSIASRDWGKARQVHEDWWRGFWSRSSIDVSGPDTASPMVTQTTVPLRIGADSHGEHRFRGRLGPVGVWNRALTTDELAAVAYRDPAAPRRVVGPHEGLVVAWDGLDSPGRSPTNPPQSQEPLVNPPASGPSVRDGHPMSGETYAEFAHSARLDLTSFTLAADIYLADAPPAGVRIVDKSVAGTSDGYLLDTYPGGSLRSIIARGALTYDAKLEKDTWYHVAATFDAATGTHRLFLDGKIVAQRVLTTSCSVSQAYALQRFVNACAGRGAFPIKFNGSLFTVDARENGEQFDPDYRRWGGCYWFQNTRLPYATMLAAGDLDMLEPLFRMYLDALPLALERTRLYYGHDGAFFPETMFFWGTYQNEIYGWDRKGKPLGLCDNTYIRYYWSGALELLTMALDRWQFSEDDKFLRESLLPLADAIVNFYDQHYPRDAKGKIRFEPAASLETWHVAVNPLPEIAGLRSVLPRLLALPGLTASRVKIWTRLLGEVPEIPVKTEGKDRWLLPAEQFSHESNVENPELYAVWPYKLYGLGRPDLDVAELTYDKRKHKGTGGWFQNAIQAACLGRAREAADMVVKNFTTRHAGSRFPAFWGPNYDWVPDQDHGAVAMTALQQMLLQGDGDRILLFPAWPKKWDVKFRLHAPRNTVVEAEFKDGEVRSVKVTPPARAKDVVVHPGQ